MRLSDPPKPTRSKVLSPCRVSENERDEIKSRAKQSGLSLSEFQRRACLNPCIVMPEPLANIELIKDLKRIGVNFNQYVKKLNATGKDSQPEVRRVSLQLETLLDALIK